MYCLGGGELAAYLLVVEMVGARVLGASRSAAVSLSWALIRAGNEEMLSGCGQLGQRHGQAVLRTVRRVGEARLDVECAEPAAKGECVVGCAEPHEDNVALASAPAGEVASRRAPAGRPHRPGVALLAWLVPFSWDYRRR
jgi:hypothetical protein